MSFCVLEVSEIINYSKKEEQLINEMKLNLPGTYFHSLRVQALTENMLTELTQLGIADFSEQDTDAILKGALMHDIGKLFIKKAVLKKASALTDGEMKHIASHTRLGYDAIKNDLSENEHEIIKNICLYHHERIDGSGYEHKKDLPIYLQIVSLCDVFDALHSDRSYHRGLPKEDCMNIIRSGKKRSGLFDKQLILILEKAIKDIE